MFDDSDVSMGGLVLECYICQRLLIFPIHRKECLKDWNKHGRICLKCLLRTKFSDKNLEGYILESEIMVDKFGIF